RRARERRLVPSHQLLGRALELIRSPPELRAETRGVGLPLALCNRLHLRLDRSEEARPEIVDLLRGPLCTGVVRDERCVAGLAARERPEADVGAGAREPVAREVVAIAPPTRTRD